MIGVDELEKSVDSACRRFAAKIKVQDQCWIWQGGTRGGYGVFWNDGKNRSAHRWSYGKFVKKTLRRYVICHRCDNPLCVNPSHLFQGTQTTNMRDAAKKNRLSNRKLTPTQIAYVLESSESDSVVAAQFEVWPTTIRRVRASRLKTAEVANG